MAQDKIREETPPFIAYGHSVLDCDPDEASVACKEAHTLEKYLHTLNTDPSVRMQEFSIYNFVRLRATSRRPVHRSFLSIWGVARVRSSIRTMVQRSTERPRQRWVVHNKRARCVLFYAEVHDVHSSSGIEAAIRNEGVPARKIIGAIEYAAKHSIHWRASLQLCDPLSPFFLSECAACLGKDTRFDVAMSRLTPDGEHIKQYFVQSSSFITDNP